MLHYLPMPGRGRLSVVAVLFLTALIPLGSAAVVSAQPTNERGSLRPDRKVQTAIRKVIGATKKEEQEQALDELRKGSGKNHSRLIPQLVYFTSRAKGTREGMAAAVIADRLRIREDDIVRALVDYLDSPDSGFRAAVHRLIMDLEPGLRDRTRTFPTLYSLLETHARQSRPPPLPLVKFIYHAQPGTALINMKNAYMADKDPAEHRRIVWAEHVVSDAIWKKRHRFQTAFGQAQPAAVKELTRLALHPAWWVRLYVAAILKQHPEFGNADLRKRLSTDKNEWVRETAGGR